MAARREAGLLNRLTGLETEYAIRFTPDEGAPRPGNDVIYEAFVEAIERLIRLRPGERRLARNQFFTENGGAFYYESLPTAPDGGLLEGATPECRGPAQALLYQRALDRLLIDATPDAERVLRRRGFAGTVGLLKNCRDAEGNVYGAQENYEAELAGPLGMMLWRTFLVLLLPVLLLTALLTWIFILATLGWLLVGMVLLGLAALVAPRHLEPAFRRLTSTPEGSSFQGGERALSDIFMWLEIVLWWPVVTAMGLALKALAFRRFRRGAQAFLISRPIVTGAGTLDTHSLFGLSEKGPAIRREMRISVMPEARGIFDPGNLMKHGLNMVYFAFKPYWRMFRRRQRLQLGLSDANMAQLAEYLKVGTTLLMLDMAEQGALDDMPRPRDPIGALHQIVSDPTLQATVELRDGSRRTALELQRLYHTRALSFLDARGDDVPAEARRVVRVWGEVLEALEEDPSRLIGRIDWVTKRYLMESVAPHGPFAVQKKIDLKYHELGTGYLASLEAHEIAVQLVEPDAVVAARHEAPSDTPARLRAELMRAWDKADIPVEFAWDSVKIGGFLNRRVISLDQRH